MILEGASRENRKDEAVADIVSENHFGEVVSELLSKYLCRQECSDLSPAELLAIQQVILDNLAPISDHYWHCLSTIFLKSFPTFSDDVKAMVLQKGMLRSKESVEWALEIIMASPNVC